MKQQVRYLTSGDSRESAQFFHVPGPFGFAKGGGRRRALAIFLCVGVLSGCASQPLNLTPGQIDVVYSPYYPDGSRLKEEPEEVTIVSRNETVKSVAGQLALNIVGIALGGFVGIHTFSKDQLKGKPIEGVNHRENLHNPVATEFVARLHAHAQKVVRDDPELSAKTYSDAIRVAGGSARLVYENLGGDDEEIFRLKSDLVVYKRKETTKFLADPNVIIDCQAASLEARPLSQWAQDDFRAVGEELRETLASCERKVLDALPNMLRQ